MIFDKSLTCKGKQMLILYSKVNQPHLGYALNAPHNPKQLFGFWILATASVFPRARGDAGSVSSLHVRQGRTQAALND